MTHTGGSWFDHPGGSDYPGGEYCCPNYSSGEEFWGNDDFGRDYQKNYGGGPVRDGFGFGGRRQGPYSGLLHVLVRYLYFFAFSVNYLIVLKLNYDH